MTWSHSLPTAVPQRPVNLPTSWKPPFCKFTEQIWPTACTHHALGGCMLTTVQPCLLLQCTPSRGESIMCLQMLESLAGQDAAGSARQAAAWCLAAAAAAARAASRGAQSLQAGASPPQGINLIVQKAAAWLSISCLLCTPLSTRLLCTHLLCPAPPWGLSAAYKSCLSVGESQAATYTHLPAGKSAQGASTEHAALAALPADSAMKALVEHLAGSSSAAGLLPYSPAFHRHNDLLKALCGYT